MFNITFDHRVTVIIGYINFCANSKNNNKKQNPKLTIVHSRSWL